MLPDSVQASEALAIRAASSAWNGAVRGGLLFCTTTHAPHGPEVEQILSNFMALLDERRASCDRGFHKGQQGEHCSKK